MLLRSLPLSPARAIVSDLSLLLLGVGVGGLLSCLCPRVSILPPWGRSRPPDTHGPVPWGFHTGPLCLWVSRCNFAGLTWG